MGVRTAFDGRLRMAERSKLIVVSSQENVGAWPVCNEAAEFNRAHVTLVQWKQANK